MRPPCYSPCINPPLIPPCVRWRRSHERQRSRERVGGTLELQRDADDRQRITAVAGQPLRVPIIVDINTLLGQQVGVGERCRPRLWMALAGHVPGQVVGADRVDHPTSPGVKRRGGATPVAWEGDSNLRMVANALIAARWRCWALVCRRWRAWCCAELLGFAWAYVASAYSACSQVARTRWTSNRSSTEGSVPASSAF